MRHSVFKLSMLRRHLEELGHGFKLSEVEEALNILSSTFIESAGSLDDEPRQTSAWVHRWHDFDRFRCGLCRPGSYW